MEPTEPPHLEPTGVPGLDDVLTGGLPAGQLYLVEGASGAGKTTLGLQFLLEGTRRGQTVMWCTLAETESQLKATAASHGWDLAAAGPAPRRDGNAVARLRVLVAEDNRDTADALRLVLEGSGCDVSVAHSGPAALEAARRTHPDAVICDIGLPGMSGYEVARALRDDADLDAVLIAITGYGTAADRAAALSAGFDAHFPKPVSPDELMTALRRRVRSAARGLAH